MDSYNLSNDKKVKPNKYETKNKLKKIKSDYILKRIFDNLPKKKSLKVIKNNKLTQKRLNIDINSFKEFIEIYSSIEIELILNQTQNWYFKNYKNFINYKKEEENYYHIYPDNGKDEIKRNYLDKNDKITKVNIVIDYQIKSFENLFKDAKCIEYIDFIKFYRNNINNMSCMFYGCSSLKEIKLSNFNTDNVTNMSYMFYGCFSLKEINLSNCNTNNVTNMRSIFILVHPCKK